MDAEERGIRMASAALKANVTLAALGVTLGVRDGDVPGWMAPGVGIAFVLAVLASAVVIFCQAVELPPCRCGTDFCRCTRHG